MTLAVLGENSSEEGFRVPSPQDDDSEQEAIEEDSDDRRRYESDGMLAQAYRELSEASRDMATWSHATSVSCPIHPFFRETLRIPRTPATYSKVLQALCTRRLRCTFTHADMKYR